MIQEGCCKGQKVRHTADSAEKRCGKAMQQSNDIAVVQWCRLRASASVSMAMRRHPWHFMLSTVGAHASVGASKLERTHIPANL